MRFVFIAFLATAYCQSYGPCGNTQNGIKTCPSGTVCCGRCSTSAPCAGSCKKPSFCAQKDRICLCDATRSLQRRRRQQFCDTSYAKQASRCHHRCCMSSMNSNHMDICATSSSSCNEVSGASVALSVLVSLCVCFCFCSAPFALCYCARIGPFAHRQMAEAPHGLVMVAQPGYATQHGDHLRPQLVHLRSTPPPNGIPIIGEPVMGQPTGQPPPYCPSPVHEGPPVGTPINQVPEGMSVRNAVPVENVAPDAPLREGWAEAQDPSGKVYYYNTTTHETSWERP